MIIYGAGGHAHVVIDIIETIGKKIDFIVDDNPEIDEELGYKVLRPQKYYDEAIIAIGDCENRRQVAETIKVGSYPTLVHPSAIVSKYAVIGGGSVVVQGAIVQSCARVGRHCIVNTGSSVGHDALLEDFVHVASHATILGNVTVGECSWIGAGAVVCQGVHIGKNVMIGAGSVVTHDIPDNVTAYGNPCEVKHTNPL